MWFYLNIVFSIIYLTWRLLYTIPLDYGIVSAVAGIALYVVEFFGLIESIIHYYNLRNVRVYICPEVPDELYPDVDVFIATYNESEDILYKTANACCYMDYPDKGKVHIYLCDDGRRASVRALADKLGIGYLDRPDNKHAKAGNLNSALAKTSSPYVVTLDADMIPHHDFLLETVPFFIKQEMLNEGKKPEEQTHIGFVQTPQAFYNPDLFQFNLFSEGRIPNEQDYFYRNIQVSRNKTNSAIYGGSNTVISRRAIDEIGGFFTESITEDFATGMLIQKAGYLCIALEKVLASGLSPTDLQSLVNQRIRWARGVIATSRKMHPLFSRKLTVGQKVNYWASMWYWYSPLKRLAYFMSPILFSVFGYMVLDCTLGEIIIFWLPMYVVSSITLRTLSNNLRTTKWTNLYETIMFPFLLVPVMLETFGITMKKFKVTSKGGDQKEQGINTLFLIPFAILGVLSVIGTLNCLRIMLASGSVGPIVVLFWLITNLFSIVMAIFFILGRTMMRKAERVFVRLPCEIVDDNATYSCNTVDMSETGVAVVVDAPVYIAPDKTILLRISTDRYCAELEARNVLVSTRGNLCKYAFVIERHRDSLSEYMQILYDRVPTLPQQLDKTSGSFDDLRINVRRRVAKLTFENRGLPRIVVGADIADTEGRSWKVHDFNFQYCTIDSANSSTENISLVIDKDAGLVLDCHLERRLLGNRLIYRVVNLQELEANDTKRMQLNNWVATCWQDKIAADRAPKQKPVSDKTDKMFVEMDEL